MKRISDTMEVTDEGKLDLWACNDRPADVAASGHHHRRIVRRDGIYIIDSGCILRSTETAFHLTIDLRITISDMPHYQRRWVRLFDRQLLQVRAAVPHETAHTGRHHRRRDRRFLRKRLTSHTNLRQISIKLTFITYIFTYCYVNT